MHFRSAVAPSSDKAWLIVSRWPAAVLWLILAWPACAQNLYAWEAFEKRIDSARTVQALGSDLFGDQVSLQTGGLSFRVTDVSLPGNDGLAVAFTRTYTVRNTRFEAFNEPLHDWKIELPRLVGTFAPNWVAGASSVARCSDQRPPEVPATLVQHFMASDFWQGVQLELPGGGGGELLVTGAGVARPQDGGTYRWTSPDGQIQVACLSSILNGSGEGFIARLPDGRRIWFNWMAQRPVQGLRSTIQMQGFERAYATLALAENSLYATRIEDRHGNWVEYSYGNAWNAPVKLTRIRASDGRELNVGYDAAAPARIASVSDGIRTWRYGYGTDASPAVRPILSSVTLPDGTQWRINFAALSHSPIEYSNKAGAMEDRSCEVLAFPQNFSQQPVGVITHPSGAVGTFRLRLEEHGRSNVTVSCANVTTYPAGAAPGTGNNTSDDNPLFVMSYWAWSLATKEISGPGLEPLVWSYAYASDRVGHYYPGTTPEFPVCQVGAQCYRPACTSDSCAGTAQTRVTGPEGTWTRYVFGNSWQYNEGKLLRVETGQGTASLRTEIYAYDLSQTDKAYPARYGTSLRINVDGFDAEFHRPSLERTTVQDGTTFRWQVASTCAQGHCLDAWARPTRVVLSNSAGFSKTEDTGYYDHAGRWVLGQVALVAVDGRTLSHADYDPVSANLLRIYGAGGELRQSLGYHADGTVASVTDGLQRSTWLEQWYRGIPRQIRYADGTAIAATVNGQGQVTSTTDENGYVTQYGYDAGGRLAQVTWPGGDSVAWAPTAIAYEQVPAVEYGIGAGHWRRTESQGSYRKVAYFDALWRPLLEREFDAADPSGTERFVRRAYDRDGRLAFEAYPSASPSAGTGLWYGYDGLGRRILTQQDSELGRLETRVEYMAGLRQRVTNPLGVTTETAYQAFDTPGAGAPIRITAALGRPEQQVTQLERDVLGLTRALTRSGLRDGVPVSVTRRYVYDAQLRLCKRLEPETGATVMAYDAAGNLAWEASGLALPGTSDADCNADRAAAHGSSRRVDRTYDARHRLTALTFPDSNGNQSWTYTPDGLPASITTLNVGGTTSVVNTYGYNRRRLMTAETAGVPGWYTWTLQYAYNANGHLAAQTYPSGLVVGYAPNALGQATQAGSYATGVQYHPNGAIKQFTYGNGLVHTMVQNARQLPARSTDIGGALDHEYGYDGNGNVVATIDHNDSARSRWMAYDPLGRLTDAGSVMFGGDHWHRFTYDALDNLRSWKLAGVKDYAHYVYDASNRLTAIQNTGGSTLHTLAYDVQGNLASKDAATFSFDYGNRLRVATGPGGTESYRYDGHGRRVLAWTPAGGKRSFYAANGQLIHQHSDPQARTLDHVYLAGSLVAIRENPFAGGSVVKYQHTDALGSPVAISNAAGTVTERTNYDPYGGAISKSIDGVGYTGHVMDPVTGLAYMQQRYYDPAIGRFLSVDPVASDATTGWNFNRYNYAANNPYRFTDPDGREIELANGAPADFLRNAAVAIRYLNAHGLAGAVGYVKNHKGVVTLAPAADRTDVYQNRYDPNTNTLYWADQGTLELTDPQTGDVANRSPALVLGHEFEHAANHLGDPRGFASDIYTPDAVFGNAEEAKVIEEYENPAARKLGEPTRQSHQNSGKPVVTKCVTENCP